MDKLVFVSHSSHDYEIANEICEFIESYEIGCWIAPRDVLGGRHYADEIVKAIKKTKVVLIIASQSVNHSEQILNEIEIAINNSRIILPFKIDDFIFNDSCTYYLKRKHWIEAIPDPQEYYIHLVKTLKYLLVNDNINLDTKGNQHLVSLAKKNRLRLQKENQEKRISFCLSIAEDEYEDVSHRYESIKRVDVLDSMQGKYSSYRWLKIVNVSDRATSHIIHKECGENKIFFPSMRIVAREVTSMERLIVESVTDVQPNFIQAFNIFFTKPLLPGESYELFYRIDWPGETLAYCEHAMSQSICFSRYQQGVGELVFGIMDVAELYDFEIEVVNRSFEQSVGHTIPKLVSVQDDMQLKPLNNLNLKGAYFHIENVTDSISYRIFYKIKKEENIIEEGDFF